MRRVRSVQNFTQMSAHTSRITVVALMVTSADWAMYIAPLECAKLVASLRKDDRLQRAAPSRSRMMMSKLKRKLRLGLAELPRILTNSPNRSTLFPSMLMIEQAFHGNTVGLPSSDLVTFRA